MVTVHVCVLVLDQFFLSSLICVEIQYQPLAMVVAWFVLFTLAPMEDVAEVASKASSAEVYEMFESLTEHGKSKLRGVWVWFERLRFLASKWLLCMCVCWFWISFFSRHWFVLKYSTNHWPWSLLDSCCSHLRPWRMSQKLHPKPRVLRFTRCLSRWQNMANPSCEVFGCGLSVSGFLLLNGYCACVCVGFGSVFSLVTDLCW
jgi:hypothetical protein